MSEPEAPKPKIISLHTRREFTPPPVQTGDGPRIDDKTILALDTLKDYVAQGRCSGLLMASFDRNDPGNVIVFTQLPMDHPEGIGMLLLLAAARLVGEHAADLFYNGPDELAELGGFEDGDDE